MVGGERREGSEPGLGVDYAVTRRGFLSLPLPSCSCRRWPDKGERLENEETLRAARFLAYLAEIVKGRRMGWRGGAGKRRHKEHVLL